MYRCLRRVQINSAREVFLSHSLEQWFLMANQYSDPKYITTSVDLKNIISRCQKCFNITLNGSLIVPLNSLPTLTLPKTNQKKYFVIVHISNHRIGHWVAIAIYRNNSKAILIDPANEINNSQASLDCVQAFCELNKLQIVDFATRTQSSHTNVCGQIVTAFLGKMSDFNYNSFLNLKQIMRSYSVEFNEHHLTSYTQQHFNVSFN